MSKDIVVTLENRPGQLASVGEALGGADVNIEVAYLATGTRLALGVDDMEKARGAV